MKLFTGDSRKQFTYFGLENMTEIVDLRSALNQFRLIVEEGEGSSLFTLTGGINKESHFLKFAQIYTKCDINITSTNMNSPNAQVTLEFTDGDYELNDDIEMINKWNSQTDQEVDTKIAE